MAFTIKQNDTRPIYIAALVTNPGVPGEAAINLTTATSVKFIMRRKGFDDEAGPKVNAAATIEDAPNGIVTYTWAEGDTDEVGEYDVEFEITWDDDGVETVPNNGYRELEIKDDLG